MIGRIIRRQGVAIVLSVLIGLIHGVSSADRDSRDLKGMGMVGVSGRAHAGTPARPLAQSPCRLVDAVDGLELASTTTDAVGAFTFSMPPDREGFILCAPAAIPSLALSAFVSTVGAMAGAMLLDEEITPASTVIADVIRANQPEVPQERKAALLDALARQEDDITALVTSATLVYQALFDAQISPSIDFAGEGRGVEPTDMGGVSGETSAGGEASPLAGATCVFAFDAGGRARSNTILSELHGSGQLHRQELQEVATTLINPQLDAARQRAITQAFANLFPDGIGPPLMDMTDDAGSATPGRYVLPVPAGVPGMVTCTPEGFNQLVVHACIRARTVNEMLEAEDLSPITTVVCDLASAAQQASTRADRDLITQDLLARLTPLRIRLSEDRNGNGLQDPTEPDVNMDGRFSTIARFETTEPLMEADRPLALLGAMSTTIFDALRIQREAFSFEPSFAEARADFFMDGQFEEPYAPIAVAVNDALTDTTNQAALGTSDVTAAAATGTLQGTVMDIDEQPLSGVQVVVSRDNVVVPVLGNPAMTDDNGQFQFVNLPVGPVTVTAFLDEFQALQVSTQVVAIVPISLELRPTRRLEVRPSALDFGTATVMSTQTLPVMLVNTDLADLMITGLRIEPEGATAFRFSRRPVGAVVVAAGSAVTVHIDYSPTVVGASLATLVVESDASRTPMVSVPLIGTAVSQPVPRMTLSQASLGFGEVQLGEARTLTLVVGNSGTAPLSIDTLSVSAAEDAGLALEQVPTLPVMLPTGGELALRIRFEPMALGLSRGLVRIGSASVARGQRTVALSGMGVDMPSAQLEANPFGLEFGEVQVNVGEAEGFVTKTVTLNNFGTAPLNVNNIRVDATPANEFLLLRAPTLPLIITPGGGLTLGVQYRPTQVGAVTGAVRIRSDDARREVQSVALSGTGNAAPVPRIEFNTSSLDFGRAELNMSRELTLEMSNTGTEDLMVTNLGLESPPGNVFSLLRPPETPFTVVPGASRQLRVQFLPNMADYAAGTLQIASNDPEQPTASVSLAGEGTPQPQPRMVARPTVVAFGEVQVDTSRRIVVTISNPGTADLEITSFDGSVLSDDQFSLRRQPGLPVQVRPGAAIELDVVFQPRRVGTVTGTLIINGNAPAARRITISLNGTATPEALPRMRVQPRNVDFGEIQVGTTQTERVTIHNDGTGDLIVNSLSLTSRSSPDFRLTRLPSGAVTVVSGSSVQVRVEYQPRAIGAASGAVRILSNDPDLPSFTVGLGGIGSPEPAPQINVDTRRLSFGQVQEGERRRKTLTVSNPGTATLEITNLRFNNDVFRLANPPTFPIRVRVQSSVALEVLYEPNMPGEDTGTIRIDNNSLDDPEVVVTLQGTAAAEPRPRIEIDPESVRFERVEIGSQRSAEIAIQNTGNASLRIAALRVDGGPRMAFRLADNPAPLTVVEGGEIQVEVLFEPNAEGEVTGAFIVDSNADNEEMVTVSLNGTGLPEPAPQIEVTPERIEFPKVEIGMTRQATLTIHNRGTANLEVQAINLDAGADNEFSLSNALTYPLNILPEGAIEVQLAYTPMVVGLATGTLTVQHNAPNPLDPISISGEGTQTPSPQIQVDPTMLAFPEVEVGSTREAILTVTNVGTATLHIRQIVVESEPAGVFRVREDVPAMIEVAPQGEAAVPVLFTPQSVDSVSGRVQFLSDAVNDDALPVPLSGKGAAQPMPDLEVLPPSLNFGQLTVGETRTLMVSMRNRGTANLDISNWALNMGDRMDFRLDTLVPFPVVVPPNDVVTAEISFVPQVEGSATATFVITSNDMDSPENVPIIGTARAEPVARIAVTPSPVEFGGVPLGQTTQMTVNVANEGNAELNVTALTIAGGSGQVFQLAGDRNAPFLVAPGTMVPLELTFTPDVAGLLGGSLTLVSNASNGAETVVPLRGTGLAAAITLEPEALAFGGVPVGSSLTMGARAVNTGTAPLMITAITPMGADFILGATDTLPVTLMPNEASAFEVIYQPSTGGPASGLVRVSNNSATMPAADLQVSGTGISPEIAVDVTSLAFGDVPVMERSELAFTLSNPSAAPLALSSITVTGDGFALSEGPIGPMTLNAGESRSVAVGFAPANEGPANGEALIISNASNAPELRVELSGTGVAPPAQLVVTPLAWDFGEVPLGTEQTTLIDISNLGGSPLTVSAINLVEGADMGFTLQTPLMAPLVIAPGQTEIITVGYRPLVEGPAAARLVIMSDVGQAEVTFNGVGVTVPEVLIEVSPLALAFGDVVQGTPSALELTIGNPGTTPLVVSAIEISEGAEAGFGLSEVFLGPMEVAPGTSFPVSVVLNPTGLGEVMGALSVLSNATAGAVMVTLSGRGTPAQAPALVAIPEALDFGEVMLESMQTLGLTLSNVGTAPARVNMIGLSAGGDMGFAVVNPPTGAFDIMPGDMFMLQVQFAPLAEGPVMGNLQVVQEGADVPPLNVALSGTGVLAPMRLIQVTPADQVDFGEVEQMQTQTALVTIGNIGEVPLTIQSLSIPEGAEMGFALEAPPAGPIVLAPQETREVMLTFTPVAEGVTMGSFRVESDATNLPVVELTLRGTGVSVPMIAVSPEELSFVDIQVGETATQAVTVENTGTGPLTISRAEVMGDAAFTLTTAVGSTPLAPGGTLMLEIAYLPSEVGTSMAVLSIESNAANRPMVDVRLTGNSVPVPLPAIQVTPEALQFDQVLVGDRTMADVRVRNTGAATLNVDAPVITGDASDFSIESGAAGFALEPNDEAVITVAYQPSQEGSVNAMLTINSNAENTPAVMVRLQATAIEPPRPRIEVTPSELDFGDIVVGEMQALALMVSNPGTGDLEITSINLAGANVFTLRDAPGSATLAPGETLSFSVIFAPESEGQVSGDLTLMSNADGMPSTRVELRGRGIVLMAEIDVQPSRLTFPSVEIGQSAKLEIQVSNTGNAVLQLTRFSVTEPSFVIDRAPDSVAPGNTDTIEVTFAPDREDTITGELIIENNSQNMPEVRVSLEGMGVAAMPTQGARSQ